LGNSHIVVTSAVNGAKWLHSYFIPERDEIICDWEASDKEAIRQSVKVAEHLIPVKDIYAAVYMDPAFLK